jgi:TatD DNase family protein
MSQPEVAEMRWIDSHCHTEDDATLDRARADGVDRFVVVGCDLASSQRAVAAASRRDDVYATVGLHPHEAQHLDAEWDRLVALVDAPKVVAIGEAGFDLYYRHSEPTAQADAFARQIDLANERDLPLVIHSRDAWDDTFRVLEQRGVPRRTVFHCFTGGPTEAQRALDRGCSLSFSGIVSFKTADELRAAAAITPADRLLCETDSPYLAPVPKRGQPNEPGYLPFVGRALADARGETIESIATLTATNARTLFGLDV